MRGANRPTEKELTKIFDDAKKIFFVGIGGISMSSLAEYCIYLGKEVYGYDRERNEACKKLEQVAKNIKYCSTPDSASHMDLVVYTTAVPFDNFEIQCAIREGLPLISRAELLNCIMQGYKNRIGVAGMHGKSTVSAMIGHIYEEADRDPTIFCGAVMKGFLSPYKFGKTNDFIFEACEYKDAFLKFSQTDAVILNMDLDHPDYFTSREQIISSFQKYAKKSKRVFLCADDEMSRELKVSPSRAVRFGIYNEADYVAKEISLGECTSFSIFKEGVPIVRCKMRGAGLHTVYNGLCAFAVAYENGINKEAVKNALYSFSGTERRLEYYKKSRGGGRIFIDYAHHPREISATLSALKNMGYSNILCVFQPHTFSRTHFLYKEFCRCFGDASRLIITDTYSAREENVYGIKERELARAAGGEYVKSIEKIGEIISECSNDAIIIMGAGDIIKIKNFIK
ncbi:MAG: UDP-N-acetylmuramate--L-alanine ligase [Clostridia bacterium]|nr:UDP-N-acetylmuramate--L-alanine ligase [Clostridia bacterium]